jgi:pimeloyl-ACP methyl ester carboxylesterase
MTFANQADIQHEAIDKIGDVTLDIRGRKLALFTSAPLDEPDPELTEAIIVIHGALRNADDYFRSIKGARHRLVIAPQFLTEDDVRGDEQRAGYLHWATEDWKGGLGEVSSFTVMDTLLRKLKTFSGLQQVTIVGNSAGGQFVNRYAAVGRGPNELTMRVRFVVANPSTYLYFDRNRPKGDAFAPNESFEVNQWRYGFEDVPDYVRETGESAADHFERYIERDVVYLLGKRDADPGAALLEIHPAAEAQGRTRRERGEIYHRYLRHKAERDVHKLVYVPRVGHDAAAMFGSRRGRKQLFPRRRLFPAR